jgi:ubiquinone/menaquinone biosynthesis C-methylase UbiE
MIKEQMDKIYRDVHPDQIPWNVAIPAEILQQAIEENLPAPSKIIDIGCGAGNYVIWFAKNGYEMTGVDISQNAIEIARRSASTAGASCKFIVADAIADLPTSDGMFDFAYEWELLHHIFPEDRDRYIRNVARVLKPGGRYLSVCFSEDDPEFGGVGKFRKTRLDTTLYFSSEKELRELFGRYFVVEDLKTVDITGKNIVHKAIYALMKKSS